MRVTPSQDSLSHSSSHQLAALMIVSSAISWWTADAQNITGGGSSHLEIEQLTECGLWSWSLYPVSPGYARGCLKITWSSTFPFMEYLIYPSLPISIRCLTDCHLWPLIFAFPASLCVTRQDMRHGEIVWLIRHFISTLCDIRWLAPVCGDQSQTMTIIMLKSLWGIQAQWWQFVPKSRFLYVIVHFCTNLTLFKHLVHNC